MSAYHYSCPHATMSVSACHYECVRIPLCVRTPLLSVPACLCVSAYLVAQAIQRKYFSLYISISISIYVYICTSGVWLPERCWDNIISPSTSAIETAREKGLSARRGGVEVLLRSGLPELRFLLRFELFAFKAFLASCQGQERETGASGLQ